MSQVAAELESPTRAHPLAADAKLAEGLRNVLGKLDQPHATVVASVCMHAFLFRTTRLHRFLWQIGSSCGFPLNLWTGRLGFVCTIQRTYHLHYSAGAHLIALELPYAEAVTTTILAGGDQCSRLLFAGSFIAAVDGLDAIPAQWTAKTRAHASVLGWAQSLAAARKE